MDRDSVLARLRARELSLREAGVRRLSLFGSVARGEASAAPDVDLAVILDPERPMGLLRFAGLRGRTIRPVGDAGRSRVRAGQQTASAKPYRSRPHSCFLTMIAFAIGSTTSLRIANASALT
ncbi:MAG TPA: nucleotidyltransferase domain-containing protein [Allosphingosinicella sp.]